MKYAAQTTVDESRSKAEIERTLKRYGADQYAYGWGDGVANIGFRMNGRMIRFALVMPPKENYRLSPTGQRRSPSAVQTAWEQGCRQMWRALALIVKAKLEAVEAGISTFESEFMAATILPDSGQTVGEWMEPQIQRAYELGTSPVLLMLPEPRR